MMSKKEVRLAENEELAIVFKVDKGMFTGAGQVFKELEITQASEKVDFSEETIRKLNELRGSFVKSADFRFFPVKEAFFDAYVS